MKFSFLFALRIIGMELISMAASIRAQISRFTNAIIACNIIDCIVCSLKDRRTTAARGLGSYSPHMREINVVDKHVIHHHSPSRTLCSKISVWSYKKRYRFSSKSLAEITHLKVFEIVAHCLTSYYGCFLGCLLGSIQRILPAAA